MMGEDGVEYGSKFGKELFTKCLADFSSVMLAVRAHPGLRGLPDHIKPKDFASGEAVVWLEYGLDMRNPITDWKITDEGVGATLSFMRTPCETFVPWEAVAAVKCDGFKPKPLERPKLKLVR